MLASAIAHRQRWAIRVSGGTPTGGGRLDVPGELGFELGGSAAQVGLQAAEQRLRFAHHPELILDLLLGSDTLQGALQEDELGIEPRRRFRPPFAGAGEVSPVLGADLYEDVARAGALDVLLALFIRADEGEGWRQSLMAHGGLEAGGRFRPR